MYFKYKVTFWCTWETTEKTDKGIIFGKDYGDAAMKLVDDYGKDCIIDIYLQELDVGNAVCEDEILEALK